MDDPATSELRIDYLATTLRELAVERLRKAIISGHFASGVRLVERTLCDQLGVSRSVIREAIRVLEAEGLVETQPRSGPVVATLDWGVAEQIYNIRSLLEADAAAACARSATPELLVELTDALEQLRRAYASAHPQTLLDATTDFYKVIFTSAGQQVAWEIVQRLNGRISRLRAITLGSTDRSISGYAHMQRIFQAICAKDADAARCAVRNHLRDAAEIARLALEQSE
jgi:DNA-binding GntR family transcriptional regulator